MYKQATSNTYVFIPKSTGAKGEFKTNDYACTIKETKP
jgi:hypothetical protein